MNDEQAKRKLAFDAYGRHAVIRDIIDSNRGSNENFKVLDIGAGESRFMRQFLPDDELYFLDPYVEADDESCIEGDGCNIPVEDDSFDFVVSSDVFEHIPPADRDSFLKENLRVARLAVILTAPFYSKETELAELHANERYRIISDGEDHRWLKEHIERGLPREREVEDLCRDEGYGFQMIPNNNLWLWENLVLATFVDYGEGIENLRDFNFFYNDKISPHDHGDYSYRKIYYIKKAEGLNDLELEDGGIDDNLVMETIKNNLGLFCHSYAYYKNMIERLEKDNSELRVDLEQTSRELHESKADLLRIRSSKSWRMTRPLRQMLRLINRYAKMVGKA